MLVVCGRCGKQYSAPGGFVGQPQSCAQCGSPVGIPASTGGGEYTVQSLPAEQWFITLPDGRLLGPASQAQFEAAAARGGIPPEANVRRGDWQYGIPFASLVARQQGDAWAAQQRAAMPYGTYSEQLARNPIGTLIAGPAMPEYRASRDPGVLAHRRRVFLRWVYLLLGMLGAAIALPLLAGLLRLEPAEGALGAGVALFLAFWPVMFFLIGMLMYSGAHFEWSWFMNSRRMRSMRAGGGDAMAKGFYIWTGGILMGLASAASIVMTLVTAGVTLFNGFDLDKMRADRNQQPPPAAQQPAVAQAAPPAAIAEVRNANPEPPPQPTDLSNDPAVTELRPPELSNIDRLKSPRRVAAEGEVQAARNKLDQDLGTLRHELSILQRMEELRTRRPNDLRLRADIAERVKQAGGKRSNVAVSRLNYDQALSKLERVTHETGGPSTILDFYRSRPPAADPPLLAAEQERSEPFPQNEVDDLERRIVQFEDDLRSSQRFCDENGLDGMSILQTSGEFRSGKVRDHLEFLAGEIDRKRGRLAEIESQWGYHSKHLDTRPAKERVAEYIAAKERELAQRSPQPSGPQGFAPGRLLDSPKIRTVAELEKSYCELLEELATHERTAASTRQSAEFFRKNLAGDVDTIAFFDKVARDAQERLDRTREAEKQVRADLEAACRREGKTSEVLKRPTEE